MLNMCVAVMYLNKMCNASKFENKASIFKNNASKSKNNASKPRKDTVTIVAVSFLMDYNL